MKNKGGFRFWFRYLLMVYGIDYFHNEMQLRDVKHLEVNKVRSQKDNPIMK